MQKKVKKENSHIFFQSTVHIPSGRQGKRVLGLRGHTDSLTSNMFYYLNTPVPSKSSLSLLSAPVTMFNLLPSSAKSHICNLSLSAKTIGELGDS